MTRPSLKVALQGSLVVLVSVGLGVSCAKRAEESDRKAAGQAAPMDSMAPAKSKAEGKALPAPAAESATGRRHRKARARPRRGSTDSLYGLTSTPDDRPAGAKGPKGIGIARRARPPRHRFAGLRVLARRKVPHMYFKHWGVNPTIDTEEAHVSTFGADVDTASFALARSYLLRDAMPPEAAIRPEEFINAFDYGYAAPRGRTALKVYSEVVPSPNRKGYHVLRIAVQGRAIKPARRNPAHLVFVVDASATMSRKGRLALVKRALRQLVSQLKSTDRVALVAFDTRARVVLPATAGSRKARILRAIASLKPRGASNVRDGLTLGFRLARRGSRRAARRVILCSDGIAGSNVTDAKAILSAVQKHVSAGVTLSAVGFGMGYYHDRLMEQLARGANGNYHYVDSLRQAKRVFVQKLTGLLQIVARDVKLQVTFDKRAVSRYRLIGYENRMLQKRQFRQKGAPAGELGAGESVTALYEVKLKPKGAKRTLGRLRVRFKAPGFSVERQLRHRLPRAAAQTPFAKASAATQLAVAVSAFSEKLRGSYWARNLTYAQIQGLLKAVRAPLGRRVDVLALRKLVARAARLDKRGDKFAQVLPLARMNFDRVPVSR